MNIKTKTIKVKLSIDALECIQVALENYGSEYGPENLNELVELLLRDVAFTISRPGSWEGAGMIDLLRAHGFKY